MDSNHMKTWIKKAWRLRLGGLGGRKSLLVYDTLEPNVTDTVKASLKREKTDIGVIPRGFNSPAT